MKCVKAKKTLTGAEIIIRVPDGDAIKMHGEGVTHPTSKGAWKRVNRGARQRARMEAAERRFAEKQAAREAKRRARFMEKLAKSDEKGLLARARDKIREKLGRAQNS